MVSLFYTNRFTRSMWTGLSDRSTHLEITTWSIKNRIKPFELYRKEDSARYGTVCAGATSLISWLSLKSEQASKETEWTSSCRSNYYLSCVRMPSACGRKLTMIMSNLAKICYLRVNRCVGDALLNVDLCFGTYFHALCLIDRLICYSSFVHCKAGRTC
jgi:hypothetical protein